MDSSIKKLGKKISENGGIFMFIRAQFSSQVASICDFLITITLAVLFDVYYVLATFIGSVCGGVVNCIVNYKWTFKSKECSMSHVAIKYAIVWIGSIFLNTSGTYLMTESLMKISWMRVFIEQHFEDFFIIPKIIVSLLVGFLWNYNMQRTFVYKNRSIKSFFKKRLTDKQEDQSNTEQR